LTHRSGRQEKGRRFKNDLSDEGDVEGFNKPLTTTFELDDTLCVEAELEDTDTVYDQDSE